MTDSWAHISTPLKLIAYLPRALAIGLLAPVAWPWSGAKGSTGGMEAVASAEMLLLYLLLPGIGCGVWELLRRRRAAHWYVLVLILVVMAPIALVVANLGILFRLRLQFLLLLLAAAAGRPLEPYRRMWSWVRGGGRPPSASLPQGERSEAPEPASALPGR